MAGNNHHQDGLGDDFFGVFGVSPNVVGAYDVPNDDCGSLPTMGLRLASSNIGGSRGGGGGGGGSGLSALELNLEQGGFLTRDDRVDQVGRESVQQQRHNSNNMTNLFSAFGQLQPQPASFRPTAAPPPPLIHQAQPLLHQQTQTLQNQQMAGTPTMRPRVRARRGQATDPHSIAERLRRERIAERMKALQELVPGCNKTDRAAMLDEIVDYVKFLRLQVKVLSMSRLGGAGAVAQLVGDVPNPSPEGSVDDGLNSPEWEKWTADGTEQEVAKLMEEDVGAAMQFLQSKALCIMPLSLASAIFRPNQPNDGS